MGAEEGEATPGLARPPGAQLLEQGGLVVAHGRQLADEPQGEAVALWSEPGGGGGEAPGELGDEVAAAAAQRGGGARELHVPRVQRRGRRAVPDREQLGVTLPERSLQLARGGGVLRIERGGEGVQGGRAAAPGSP